MTFLEIARGVFVSGVDSKRALELGNRARVLLGSLIVATEGHVGVCVVRSQGYRLKKMLFGRLLEGRVELHRLPQHQLIARVRRRERDELVQERDRSVPFFDLEVQLGVALELFDAVRACDAIGGVFLLFLGKRFGNELGLDWFGGTFLIAPLGLSLLRAGANEKAKARELLAEALRLGGARARAEAGNYSILKDLLAEVEAPPSPP